MGRKNEGETTPAELTVIGAEEVAEIVAEAPAMEEKDLPYRVSSWRGIERLECIVCPWDTLEGEAVFLDHFVKIHAPDAAPQPVKPTTLFVEDRFGTVRQIEVGGK
jgi:hypothetical protein